MGTSHPGREGNEAAALDALIGETITPKRWPRCSDAAEAVGERIVARELTELLRYAAGEAKPAADLSERLCVRPY